MGRISHIILFFVLFFVASNAMAQKTENPPNQQFLGILTLTDRYKVEPWTEKDMAIVQAHFLRLVELHKSGKVIFAGRTIYENNNDQLMGLVVFNAMDMTEAEKFMAEDPAVVANIMQSVVHPYALAVGNPK